MPGRGAALENLDDDHASAAAWARVREAAWPPPDFTLSVPDRYHTRQHITAQNCPGDGCFRANSRHWMRWIYEYTP